MASDAANLTTIGFTTDTPRAGLYTLEATVPAVAAPKTEDISLTADIVTNFIFP
jgi:hypothetical protein